MPFVLAEFVTKVRAVDHGFLRSFNEQTTALKDLLKELRDYPALQTRYREIAKILEHIPAEKKAKYKEPLAYLTSNYPNLSTPPIPEDRRARAFRIGAHLELLKSPLETAYECVIYGHAGQVPDDARFNGSFPLPFGLTLHFCTHHGQSNESNPTLVLAARPDDANIQFNLDAYRPLQISQVVDQRERFQGDSSIEIQQGNRTTTIQRDRHGARTTVKGPVMITPLSDARNAKGVIERDRLGSPVRKSGPEQIQLSKAAVNDRNKRKAAKFFGADAGLDGKLFRPTERCYNYIIKNGLGIHWNSDNPATRAPYKPADIMAVQDQLMRAYEAHPRPAAGAMPRSKPWVPHFLYVHSEGVVRLTDLLTSVHQFTMSSAGFRSGISDYYFAGCRGIHAGWRPESEE